MDHGEASAAAHDLRHSYPRELAGVVRKESLLVEDSLKLLAGQVEGYHVALVKAAIDDTAETGPSAELLQRS